MSRRISEWIQSVIESWVRVGIQWTRKECQPWIRGRIQLPEIWHRFLLLLLVPVLLLLLLMLLLGMSLSTRLRLCLERPLVEFMAELVQLCCTQRRLRTVRVWQIRTHSQVNRATLR